MHFGKAFSDMISSYTKRGKFKISKKNLLSSQDWQEGLLPKTKSADKEEKILFSSWRVSFFYILFIATFFILFLRLSQLQLIQGKRNKVLSEGNRIQIKTVHAQRGIIYDRKGEILTRNVPGFRLERSDSTFQVISRDDALHVITSNSSDYAKLELDAIRQYLYPELFSHVLGYTSEIAKDELQNSFYVDKKYRLGDRIGRMGIEESYENYLRGTDGKLLVEVDAKGNTIRELGKVDETSGKNLTLNIDLSLQQTMKDALGEKTGAVIALDPRSGAVLGLVSNPSFNTNLFTYGIPQEDYLKLIKNPSKPMFNRTIGGLYPPGSTFKLITASSALEEKTITPQTLIDDKGSISIGDFVYKGWKPEGLGEVDLKNAIGKSSDIYFYTVGGGYGGVKGVGVDGISKWAKIFGLSAKTGIDLPGESEGLIPDPAWKERVKKEQWYLGNTYHMAIGQGDVLTTPLQMAQVTSVFANGGTLYKPQIVKEIKSPTGQTEMTFNPKIIKKDFLSPSTIKVIRDGMRIANSPGGTAWPMYDFPIPTGGKTGTAEFGDPKGATHAWFTVFAPFDNPQIVVTVIVEGTYDGGGEGSTVAAPVARKVLEKFFQDKK